MEANFLKSWKGKVFRDGLETHVSLSMQLHAKCVPRTVCQIYWFPPFYNNWLFRLPFTKFIALFEQDSFLCSRLHACIRTIKMYFPSWLINCRLLIIVGNKLLRNGRITFFLWQKGFKLSISRINPDSENSLRAKTSLLPSFIVCSTAISAG